MAFELNHSLRVEVDRDSSARQSFVSQLRGYILNDMAAAMRHSFETEVAPAFERAHGRPPATQNEVHDAMRPHASFKFYSSVRYNAQEMVWRSVIPGVERALPELAQRIDAISGKAGGSLALDPALKIPANVADLPVHLMPGGYAPADNPMAGAVYDNGLAVFAAGFMGKNLDDIGQSMSNYVKHRYPDFKPQRILDCGATVGHNAAAWAETFPKAEVHAIDVSAATLRYGHGRAESLGLPVHFKQMDATALKYADNSFDVVFSSMFLHELSLRDIRRFFAEAHRVLKPGGMLLNMELPPNHELAPYDQFYLDWDSYYNVEPYYRTFRDQRPRELVEAGGFALQDYFQFTVPQFTYTDPVEFAAAINAPATIGGDTGRLSASLQWFGFGAWKRWMDELRDPSETRRQSFFESDSIDRLMTMVLELATEQWVLRERLFSIEKAADKLGIALSNAVETYQFNEQEKAQLARMRQTMIDNLMRSVNREHRRLPPFGAG